jgi:hypothetical protein
MIDGRGEMEDGSNCVDPFYEGVGKRLDDGKDQECKGFGGI